MGGVKNHIVIKSFYYITFVDFNIFITDFINRIVQILK